MVIRQPAGGVVGGGPGWSLTAYVPDIKRQIDAGYSHLEFWSNDKPDANGATLRATFALVATETTYKHTQVNGARTDWAPVAAADFRDGGGVLRVAAGGAGRGGATDDSEGRWQADEADAVAGPGCDFLDDN